MGEAAFLWNITLGSAVDRIDFLSVIFFKVRDQFFVSLVLTEICNETKLVCFKFLMLWRMEIVKSPLFKWNVSAGKVQKPAVLLVKILNYRE